ncbi:MAG: TVP38/TMEM64 family protein [Proteobacteria bacterium]|nr:TVP38/TMEM64 family protein [Pseudomonadota bacterium]
MSGNQSDKGKALKRLWPVAALIVAVAALVAFGPDNAAVFATLRAYREAIGVLIVEYAVLAGLGYMVIYAVAIAFSVPGGAMMTIIGAFLFGWQLAAVYVVFAATIGATALFLIARTAVGNRLHERAGPWMQKMEAGFQENALWYLLMLRLIPLFPFFVVNLVPAFLGVTLRTYVIGTFFGIIPGTTVFALAGGGLASVLANEGAEFDLSSVLTLEVVAALIGIALLALIPVIYKKVQARKSQRAVSAEGREP